MNSIMLSHLENMKFTMTVPCPPNWDSTPFLPVRKIKKHLIRRFHIPSHFRPCKRYLGMFKYQRNLSSLHLEAVFWVVWLYINKSRMWGRVFAPVFLKNNINILYIRISHIRRSDFFLLSRQMCKQVPPITNLSLISNWNWVVPLTVCAPSGLPTTGRQGGPSEALQPECPPGS